MTFNQESDMYPHVRLWLKRILERKYEPFKVTVYDTHKKNLSKFLFEERYHKYFKGYLAYEIKVDITGVIEKEKAADLAFVECKLAKINLRDFSQLLGYSKVANPVLSIILSPKGISRSLNLLFNVWRKYDVLYYSSDRYIIIGKWDERRGELDLSSIIPSGAHL